MEALWPLNGTFARCCDTWLPASLCGSFKLAAIELTQSAMTESTFRGSTLVLSTAVVEVAELEFEGATCDFVGAILDAEGASFILVGALAVATPVDEGLVSLVGCIGFTSTKRLSAAAVLLEWPILTSEEPLDWLVVVVEERPLRLDDDLLTLEDWLDV